MVQDAISPWATLRFALGYPDQQHLERFQQLFADAPATIEELRSLYIELFEAGLPHPRWPLLEGHYLLNRPVGDVVLENKLYFQHFGLKTAPKAAPDHLLTQLEFLAWLDHCADAGNCDPESINRARREFIQRHLAHWVPRAAKAMAEREIPVYAGIFGSLVEQIESAAEPIESAGSPL